MGVVSVVFVAFLAFGALAYIPQKDHLMSESLLREVLERMGRDLDTYLDEVGGGGQLLSMGPRADKDMEDMVYYQDSPPAIRDQEYLQHSTLWANRFMHEGGSESQPGKQMTNSKQSLKQQDTSLPAYCNPPNPCPIGYTGADSCLEDFENTAAFSREFQAQQECMCDSEHMFDCANSPGGEDIEELGRLVHQFQVEDEHKNLVAKKFHVKKNWNPYLLGEKLPVAAKKGQHVGY